MKEILLVIFLSGMLNNPTYMEYEKDYIRNIEKHVIVNEKNINVELKKESKKLDLTYMFIDVFPGNYEYLLDLIENELESTRIVGKDIKTIKIKLDDRWVVIESDEDSVKIIYERVNTKDYDS